MLSLRLQNLGFSYADHAPLFRDVTVHLTAGWTGLVGSNGRGKTTFLRLVRGELEPREGQICFEPAAPRIAFCRQRVEELDDAISAFSEHWDRPAHRLRGRLRLDPEQLSRWPSLSPGERKRWQIAAALHAEPHLLLLDEPTNHLDTTARDLLTAALAEFRGIGVLVSHDRQLLDTLTTATLRLDGGPRLWSGTYSDARSAWTREESQVRGEHERCRQEERKVRRRLADKRRQQHAAEARIGAGRRAKGPRDHDARTMAAKNRVRSAEQRLGRQVAVLKHQLEKRLQAVADVRVTRAKGRSLFVDFEPSPASRLIALDATDLRAGGRTLLRDVHLTVERDTRCWLAGDNGSGKTTLLQALRRRTSVPNERLLYLPQELSGSDSAALLDELRQLPPADRGRILELVAALGCDPERLLASAAPSPGEARKLKLAFGLGRRVWALLLDEPTNHLDLPSIERLEAMLAGYPGALVLVTHDRGLAAAATDETWRVTGGRVLAEGPERLHDPPQGVVG
jgi:ATPase subunit of ABC transporter with duplicated ATPase domains